MSYVDQVLVQAAALGVDGPLESCRTYRARAEALNEALTEARAAGEREDAALVARLVDGDQAVKAVPGQVAATEAWAYDSPASRRVVQAVARCHDLADRAAVAAGLPIFGLLQGLCADVVGESVRLTARLPRSVVDAETALRASDDAGAAWRRLTLLADRWVLAHRLAELLRNAGWVAGPPHRMGGADRAVGRTKFRFPERLPKGWVSQPEPLLLGMAAAAGCEPGLFDWDEAHGRQLAYERRHGRRGVHVHSDAPGSVTSEPMTARELAMHLPVIESTAQGAVPALPR